MRMTIKSMFIALLLAPVCACSAVSLDPVVLVDESFDAAHMAAIMVGARAWEPAIHASVVVVPHARIMEQVQFQTENVIYVLPAEHLGTTQQCAGVSFNDPAGIPDGSTTTHHETGSAVTCIDTSVVEDSGVMAHELGHALGLQHSTDATALMAVCHGSLAPTCTDWQQLHDVRGVALPGECAAHQ